MSWQAAAGAQAILRHAGHVVPVPVLVLHGRSASGQLRLVRVDPV